MMTNTLGTVLELAGNINPQDENWALQMSSAILVHATARCIDLGLPLKQAGGFVQNAIVQAKDALRDIAGQDGAPLSMGAALREANRTFAEAAGLDRQAGVDQAGAIIAKRVLMDDLMAITSELARSVDRSNVRGVEGPDILQPPSSISPASVNDGSSAHGSSTPNQPANTQQGQQFGR